MNAPKVLIQFIGKVPSSKINTSEGVKKFNEKGEIEVSLDLALQLVDNANWSCKEDLQKLAKKFKLNEKEEMKKKVEDEDDGDVIDEDDRDEEDEDDRDEEDEDKDGEDDEDEDEEDEEEKVKDVGDDDTRELIRKIPKMKYDDLLEAAEEAGIDLSKYKKKDAIQLKRDLIKVLRGK